MNQDNETKVIEIKIIGKNTPYFYNYQSHDVEVKDNVVLIKKILDIVGIFPISSMESLQVLSMTNPVGIDLT